MMIITLMIFGVLLGTGILALIFQWWYEEVYQAETPSAAWDCDITHVLRTQAVLDRHQAILDRCDAILAYADNMLPAGASA